MFGVGSQYHFIGWEMLSKSYFDLPVLLFICKNQDNIKYVYNAYDYRLHNNPTNKPLSYPYFLVEETEAKTDLVTGPILHNLWLRDGDVNSGSLNIVHACPLAHHTYLLAYLWGLNETVNIRA